MSCARVATEHPRDTWDPNRPSATFFLRARRQRMCGNTLELIPSWRPHAQNFILSLPTMPYLGGCRQRLLGELPTLRATQVPRSLRDYCKGHMRGAKNFGAWRCRGTLRSASAEISCVSSGVDWVILALGLGIFERWQRCGGPAFRR